MKSSIKLILSFLCIVVLLCGCGRSEKLKNYYKEKSNYVTVSGTVKSIYHYEKESLYESLVISFDNLDDKFSDNTFEICRKNLPVVQEKGIEDKLKIGDSVVFTTAPGFFGDGYIMPIVAITVDGEEFLSFDEGYENFLEWLDDYYRYRIFS